MQMRKINGLLQRCLTIDDKSCQKLDSSFSLIGKVIIGNKVPDIRLSRISNKDNPTILLPFCKDLKLSPKSHREETKESKSQHSGGNNQSLTIQFKNTINNNITIINNIIQQSEQNEPNPSRTGTPLKKDPIGLKSNLKQSNRPKPRKSVRFEKKISSFDIGNDENNELEPKVSCKTENDKEQAMNSDKAFEKIMSSKQSPGKDKERFNREIDRIPKCHCDKDLGAFKGFSALTYHNRNKIHYDKLTILINKNISSAQEYEGDSSKQINFFGVYHGINGDYTSSLLKKDIHNYIFNNKHVLEDTESAILKAHKAFEEECNSNYNKETLNDGSCSLIVCEINNIIYISNIGSSSCIISLDHGSEVYNLSANHTPLNNAEAERIRSIPSDDIRIDTKEKRARIYPSGLTVSRVLGFTSSKGNSVIKGKKGIDNGVISIPEIMAIEACDNMDFIIMASEGVVNYLSNKDIMKLAYQSIKESLYSSDSYEAMLDKIIAKITKEAVKRESKGNISIVLLSMSNLEMIYREKMTLKVNQAIGKLNKDKGEYTSLYPKLFSSPKFNLSKKSAKKPEQNSLIDFGFPSQALRIKPIDSKQEYVKSNTHDETKRNPCINSMEYEEGMDTGQLEEKKLKKKKKPFFCLCWG